MQAGLSREVAIRWDEPRADHVPLLAEAGVTAVVAPLVPAFAQACANAGIRFIDQRQLRTYELEEAGKARAEEIAVVRAGLWPGTRNPQAQVASATRSLWIDQNCYLVRYLQAMYPGHPAVLGYLPNEEAGVTPGRAVRFDSLELALAEAWMAGGNYLMALDGRFREALLQGNAEARSAWSRLGRTAAWLRANADLFRQPALPIITVLVEQGVMPQEIANLCHRFNVSPALAAATDPPAPDASRIRVLSAAGIQPPEGEARRRILAHATGGATVEVDAPGTSAWWRMPGMKLEASYEDREVYTVERGRIAAYREPVSDPAEFALDLIDFAGRDWRPARVWNAQGAVALATAPSGGAAQGAGAALHLLNYSQPVTLPVLAQIHGRRQRATLLAPGADPAELAVAPRGAASEVALPQLGRAASVVFR